MKRLRPGIDAGVPRFAEESCPEKNKPALWLMEYGLKKLIKKLLLVIPVRSQEDLLPVVESEEWHTVRDLFRKTDTSYNSDWNGNYVLDQDEIPWKATEDELNALLKSKGRVVVIVDGKYNISEKVDLYTDSDGSVYASEEDLETFFGPD